jgi:hypothetical protein
MRNIALNFSVSVPEKKMDEEEEEVEDHGLEEEPSNQSIDEMEVPELEDSPPPTVNVVLPSPIRSGLRVRSEVSSVDDSLEESQGLSQEVPENGYIQCTVIEERSHGSVDSGNEIPAEVNTEKDTEQIEVETDELSVVHKATSQEEMDIADVKYDVEEMTVIDEVVDDGGQGERTETVDVNEMGGQGALGESGDGVSGLLGLELQSIANRCHVKNHIFVGLKMFWDHLCGLVVKSSWLQTHRSWVRFQALRDFLSRTLGLERGPLSLVSINEELLERKSSCSGLEN